MISSGSCTSSLLGTLQRALFIFCDLFLVVHAAAAISFDWRHECDEALHFYGLVCIVLCLLDIMWEFVRCNLESSLDKLQDNSIQEAMVAANTGENLLTQGEESPVGSPLDDQSDRGGRSSLSATLSQGMRRDKVSQQKRTTELQFWSLVFTCMVSVTFAFFAAHDEECEQRVPSLYAYIHTFTYVFIFRVGLLILLVCCRTVKNYEDAAAARGGLSGSSSQFPQGRELVSF